MLPLQRTLRSTDVVLGIVQVERTLVALFTPITGVPVSVFVVSPPGKVLWNASCAAQRHFALLPL
jgi:hypothetical protein